MTKAQEVLNLLEKREDDFINTIFIDPLVKYLDEHIPRNQEQAILAENLGAGNIALMIEDEDGYNHGKVEYTVDVNMDALDAVFKLVNPKVKQKVEDKKVEGILVKKLLKEYWEVGIADIEGDVSKKSSIDRIEKIGEDVAKEIFKLVNKMLR